jgi:hypothetical protein
MTQANEDSDSDTVLQNETTDEALPEARGGVIEARPPPIEEPTPVGTPLQHVQHHRLGGSGGVRVTTQGLLQEPKRVGSIEPDDHKRVPRDVLTAVRDLIDARGETQLTATERLLAVYDLLTPWLDVE